MYKNYVKMVKGYRIDTGLHKRLHQKRILQKHLEHAYKASAKQEACKTGVGLYALDGSTCLNSLYEYHNIIYIGLYTYMKLGGYTMAINRVYIVGLV